MCAGVIGKALSEMRDVRGIHDSWVGRVKRSLDQREDVPLAFIIRKVSRVSVVNCRASTVGEK